MNAHHTRQLARLDKLSQAEKAVLAAELCAEVLLAAQNLDKFIRTGDGSNANWGVMLNASKLFSTPQQRRLLAIVNSED